MVSHPLSRSRAKYFFVLALAAALAGWALMLGNGVAAPSNPDQANSPSESQASTEQNLTAPQGVGPEESGAPASEASNAQTTGSIPLGEDQLNQAFTSSDGTSSPYHVFTSGVNATGKVGALIHFHGDGGYEFESPTGSSSASLGADSGVISQAAQRGMITFVPRTPDTSAEDINWWNTGVKNADFMKDFIEQVAYGQYNVDPANVWVSGYSGGAEFITQYLLPKHSSVIQGGGAVIIAGGGAPSDGHPPAANVEPFADSFKQNFSLFWYTGMDDVFSYGYASLDGARTGHAFYNEQGFTKNTIETPEGIGHEDGIDFAAIVNKGFSMDNAESNPAGAAATPNASTQEANAPAAAANAPAAEVSATVGDAPAAAPAAAAPAEGAQGAAAAASAPAESSQSPVPAISAPAEGSQGSSGSDRGGNSSSEGSGGFGERGGAGKQGSGGAAKGYGSKGGRCSKGDSSYSSDRSSSYGSEDEYGQEW